jgi:hypothetical protein
MGWTLLVVLFWMGWVAAIIYDLAQARAHGDGVGLPPFSAGHCLLAAAIAVIASAWGLKELLPMHLALLLAGFTALPAGAAWISFTARVVRFRGPLWDIPAWDWYWSQSAVFYLLGGGEGGLSMWVCWTAAALCMLLGFREKALSRRGPTR